MERISFVRDKNQQRRHKLENRRKKESYIVTPPKSQMKKSLYFKLSKSQVKFGYDFVPGDSKYLAQLKEDFLTKSTKYYDCKLYPKRLGRMDKIRKKEELGIVFQKNPFLKYYSRANQILANLAFGQFMDGLKTMRND